MNQNRPFYSTNTNLYNESFRSSAPTTLNGENVILSQEQQRRVCDTLNTSIVGNPPSSFTNQQMLCAQKQYFPGGVLFTFPSLPQNTINQGGWCKCLTTPFMNTMPVEYNYFQPQPAATVNTFFPSSMDYQQLKSFGGYNCQQHPSKDSFQLKLHHNRSTSSSDLLNHFSQVPGSKCYPDLCNINGILQEAQNNTQTNQANQFPLFPSPPVDCSSNVKKLILRKNATQPCGHVVDILNETIKKEEDERKVSFSDSNSPKTAEKGFQIESDCICDEKKCKKKSKLNKNKQNNDGGTTDRDKVKKDNKKKTQQVTSEGNPSTDDETKSETTNKKPWWKREKKIDSGRTLSESTDSDGEKPKKKPKRKRRKQKTRKEPKKGSDDGSGTDTYNTTDSSSENAELELCLC